MKSITIAGNIGKSAETRHTPNGDAVTSWSVAVEERKGQDKRTIWFDCSLWGKRGESLAQYLTKGGKVAVSGELSTREHDGKTYLTVRAEQVTLLGSGQDEQRRDPARQAPAGRGADLDQDIPFAAEWRI
jgi:single-strand DNA-binding protein